MAPLTFQPEPPCVICSLLASQIIAYHSLLLFVSLPRPVCTATFKELSGAQGDDTDGTVLTQQLCVCWCYITGGVTASTEQWLCWDKVVVTDGASTQAVRAVTKSMGDFRLHCRASVCEDTLSYKIRDKASHTLKLKPKFMSNTCWLVVQALRLHSDWCAMLIPVLVKTRDCCPITAQEGRGGLKI